MHRHRLAARASASLVRTAWLLVLSTGCGEQEPLVPDPGVSPFYPGPKAVAGAPGTERSTDLLKGGSLPVPAGSRPAGSRALDADLAHANSVDRRLKVAMLAMKSGERAKAVGVLDDILKAEPTNREALVARATLALDESFRAKTPEERVAATSNAGALMRRYIRTVESPSPLDVELFGTALFTEAQALANTGEYAKAVAVLKEASDTGFDSFAKVETDDSLKSFRARPEFTQALEAVQKASLARARDRIKDRLAKPPGFAFDFTLPDLDGKQVSLAQFRGKVVLIDFWGTWCGPCREALPSLVKLYLSRHHRGLEIVGLGYERNASTPEEGVKIAREFLSQARLPYTCLMGDEATLQKVPGFVGFPTSIVLDRSGKVRLLITENQPSTQETLAAAVEVLLAEPAPAAATGATPGAKAASSTTPAAEPASSTAPAAKPASSTAPAGKAR